MKGLLLDTSVLAAFERGRLNLEERFREHADAEIDISAVTASELLHGVHRAQTPEQRARRSASVENVLATIPVLPFDTAVARVHAGVWADLALRGQPIGERDLLIAATAIAAGYGVATRDLRSCNRSPA